MELKTVRTLMVNGNTFEPICLSLLKHCKTLKTFTQLHTQIIKSGLDSDQFITGNLIHHCTITLSNTLNYVHSLLTHSPNPTPFMYNTINRGFSESDNPQNSLITFINMLRNSTNLQPDSFSFAFVLKTAANMQCYNTGIQVHSQAIVYGLDTHLYVGTTLVSFYTECGCVDYARKVFNEMPERNIVAWNAMVTACVKCCDVKGAEMLYRRMPVRDLVSDNIMLTGYMKAGEIHLGKNLFDEMNVKDDVSWSTMIVGFSHNGCFDEAFDLFKNLQRTGLKPNV